MLYIPSGTIEEDAHVKTFASLNRYKRKRGISCRLP